MPLDILDLKLHTPANISFNCINDKKSNQMKGKRRTASKSQTRIALSSELRLVMSEQLTKSFPSFRNSKL
jgi:hypothetical protein